MAHHKKFKELYSTNLKKKHHNLIHYPSAIERIGPLMNYCTLRFEGKHAFFKTVQRVSHNYKNIPLTVSKKHQVYFAQNLLNSNLINQIQILDGIKTRIKDLIPSLKRLVEGKNLNNDYVELAEMIDYYGQIYKKNNIVLYSKIDNLPCFCNISEFMIYKVIIEISAL